LRLLLGQFDLSRMLAPEHLDEWARDEYPLGEEAFDDVHPCWTKWPPLVVFRCPETERLSNPALGIAERVRTTECRDRASEPS
jgi:hypothetical protein